jgi:hypothetical protein
LNHNKTEVWAQNQHTKAEHNRIAKNLCGEVCYTDKTENLRCASLLS